MMRAIAYQEIDIDTPDGLASFAQAGGGRGVPLLLAWDKRIQGFSPAAVRARRSSHRPLSSSFAPAR
jgi:hypothetical protein